MPHTLHPPEDPAYEPVHKPVNGRPPEVVAKWGPRSQLRWFRRFYSELYVTIHGHRYPGLDGNIVADYYCHSLQHRGACCSSCIEDAKYDVIYDTYPLCCCRSPFSALEDEDKIPRL